MKRVVVLLFGMFICAGVQARTFMDPPDIFKPGEEGYQELETRRFQGISSLAVSESGRIWAVWYGGPTPGEDRNNYVILATSGDDGETWREKFIIDPDGPGDIRAFDPNIWIDPQGKLWLFWAQHPASDFHNPHSGTWAIINSEPDLEDGEWSEPRRLTDGIMMNKPTVLSNGRWLLPVSTWRKTNYSVRAVASDNDGLSFEVVGALNVPEDDRSFDEHMFVEREDGSIRVLVRTAYGIGESVSHDTGKTWSGLHRSSIKHPSARFFIRRLDSGNLLLVKHGPINEVTGRSHLMAFVSKDDGVSWQGGLMLHERGGVSYPDGQQAADGTIYITYDYSRTGEKKIYMSTFTEEDALAGEPVSDKVRERVVISEGNPPDLDSNEDGRPLVKVPSGRLSGGEGAFELVEGAKLFANRNYLAMEMPDVLEGAKFLRADIGGQKSVEVTEGGMVYFLTPKPNRNSDSQTETLTSQGFEMVAIPEIPSFDANTTNYVTLYQKLCEEGDVIVFGKWAIPVFFED